MKKKYPKMGQESIFFEIILNILFPNLSPYKRIDCYNNADWPNEKKNEINNEIKKCLEVFIFFANQILKILF